MVGTTKLDSNLEIDTWPLEKEVAERVTGGGGARFRPHAGLVRESNSLTGVATMSSVL